MPIYAKAGKSFTPAPAGAHPAVCIDVVDLGEVKVEFKGKSKTQHKVRLVWQLDQLRDDGTAFRVRRDYTLSLHEKSSLRRDLEAWRGRQFTDEELNGFDVEVLLNKPCLLNVIHNQANGNTYANVQTIMRLPKGMTAPMPEPSYVREIDRPPEQQGSEDPGNYSDMPPGWDGVPF